jgi:hypothetical protein
LPRGFFAPIERRPSFTFGKIRRLLVRLGHRFAAKERMTLRSHLIAIIGTLVLSCAPSFADVDEDELGAWYMYMWSTMPGERNLGYQGDVQYRNWDLGRDLEQLLIRGGAMWAPGGGANRYTLGYAYVATGAYGPSSATTSENRLYQEALLPRRVGQKVYLTHRLRLEQRWVEGQDFRTRLRYFVAMNYPFNQDSLGAGAVYLSLYNEVFVNGERDIGGGRRVDRFDRNRLYAAIGHSVSDAMRLQLGYMYQKTEALGKGQLQLSLVHAF